LLLAPAGGPSPSAGPEERWRAGARASAARDGNTRTGAPAVSVGPFVCRRFHGPGVRCGGRYSDGALARAAEGLSREIDSGRDVYVYFNDDQGGHAPRDAQRLAGLIVRG